MPNRLQQVFARPQLRRRLLLVGIALAGVWLMFLDSHSLLRRVEYYADYRALSEENAQIQTDIDRLQQQVGAGLSDELVEEVAREQYGMRRPGETVYPVGEPDGE
ncbi:MAG: septum formation initiator family protein [Rhodothermales bacterium]